MKRVWTRSTKLLTGLMLAAALTVAQTPTQQTSSIQGRPGAVNYVEGNAAINGQILPTKLSGQIFLNPDETLSTTTGRAEILLTPGVFLRVGENSEVRMMATSLIKTQVELTRGQAMVEVAQLLKDNNIQVLNHGAFIKFVKPGLYRITADGAPTFAVLDGKAEVNNGDQSIELSKGKQTVVGATLQAQKFDTKSEDDLYAWSNVRSQYNSTASYMAASSYVGPYNPGWFWAAGYDSWAWAPFGGYAFSPFGWGFYGPGYLGYAGFYGYGRGRVVLPLGRGPVVRGYVGGARGGFAGGGAHFSGGGGHAMGGGGGHR